MKMSMIVPKLRYLHLAGSLEDRGGVKGKREERGRERKKEREREKKEREEKRSALVVPVLI